MTAGVEQWEGSCVQWRGAPSTAATTFLFSFHYWCLTQVTLSNLGFCCAHWLHTPTEPLRTTPWNWSHCPWAAITWTSVANRTVSKNSESFTISGGQWILRCGQQWRLLLMGCIDGAVELGQPRPSHVQPLKRIWDRFHPHPAACNWSSPALSPSNFCKRPNIGVSQDTLNALCDFQLCRNVGGSNPSWSEQCMQQCFILVNYLTFSVFSNHATFHSPLFIYLETMFH